MTPRIVFDLIEAWQSIPWNSATDADKRKSSFANEITWYSEYADGREAPKGIVAANWNDADYYDKLTKTRIEYPERLQSRLCAVFEKLGVEIEWFDMCTSCADCGKCIQMQPDCYSWQPDYIESDNGETLCSQCAEDDAETLLEAAEGGTWNNPSIDPAEHGYVALPEEYQSGWHPGQTDDPKKVLKDLRAKGIERALVVVKDVGQFDSTWQVYVHESVQKDHDNDECCPMWIDGHCPEHGR